MSNLTTHAVKELTLAGLFDKDSDYDGMLGKAALDIVKLFATQGHSGMSASIVTDLVGKLMRFEPLTPLTYGPEEWMRVTDDLWQNIRKSDVFSTDGGKTHSTTGEVTS